MSDDQGHQDGPPAGSPSAVEHWNQVHRSRGVAVQTRNQAILEMALSHLEPIEGQRLLDLGCGDGSSSLWFAARGAHVIAVDTSAVAIDNLRRYCDDHDIANVVPRCVSALDIEEVGPVDRAYGSMILHHIEPFEQFAAALRRTVVPGGKAFFFENSAASRALMWARARLPGRAWIPKYSDDDEYPLTPAEVDVLRQHFSVRQEFPEVKLFTLASTYLLRGRHPKPFVTLDRWAGRIPSLRRMSYRQCLYVS